MDERLDKLMKKLINNYYEKVKLDLYLDSCWNSFEGELPSANKIQFNFTLSMLNYMKYEFNNMLNWEVIPHHLHKDVINLLNKLIKDIKDGLKEKYND